MPKDVLRVAVKIPAKVERLDNAIKRLGGVAHLANTIRKVHQNVSTAQVTLGNAQTDKKRTHFRSH